MMTIINKFYESIFSRFYICLLFTSFILFNAKCSDGLKVFSVVRKLFQEKGEGGGMVRIYGPCHFAAFTSFRKNTLIELV